MAALPTAVIDPVAEAVFAHYQRKYSAESPRGYVGASSIGKSCKRALWYQFRWTKAAQFSGRLYRLFQTGHLEEPRINSDLRAIGCTVYETNPNTGRQWSFTEPTTGHHFRGNCDGIVTGVPNAEKSPHILECKTSSAKAFKAMQKDGVEKTKPEHFAQMQIYMHWSIALFGKDEGCKRALYVMVNKDDDDIYTERLEYDATVAQSLIDKANAIIDATEPPQRLSEDPTWYECSYCDYKSICHGQELPAVSCRTCAHSTPVKTGDAAWVCAKYDAEIPVEAQREGCGAHLYIPILLERCAKPVDGDDSHVVYQMSNGAKFINGDPDEFGAHISSKEIQATADKAALVEPRIVELRQQMIEQFPGTRMVA